MRGKETEIHTYQERNAHIDVEVKIILFSETKALEACALKGIPTVTPV